MLNSEYKKEAIANLKSTNTEYQLKYKSTMNSVMNLYNSRLKSIDLIKSVFSYINSINNLPKELEFKNKCISINYRSFEHEIKSININNTTLKNVDDTNLGAGMLAGTGVALGAGLATFGPGAAMAIATTFGTASTGVAISTLSGAAATTSALAWLGGGAVAAGGGGMSAGTALLGSFGPIGWAIGGCGLVAGGLWANSKNKKVAKEAEDQTLKLRMEISKLTKIEQGVRSVKKETSSLEETIKPLFYKMSAYNITDYKEFDYKQSDNLKTLLNDTFTLSQTLNKKVN